MYTNYVRLGTGNVLTQLDVAATNPIGCIYSPPVNQNLPLSTKGLGAQPVYKYVYYNSTTNPAPVAFPAPVYFTDESFTTVSGNAAEAFSVTGLAFIAGYLMPNTASITNLANNTTGSNIQLNKSYVWIQIGGFLAAAYSPASTAVGDSLIGIATGNFVCGRVAANTAPTNRIFGTALSAITAGVSDVLFNPFGTFWGS